MIHSLSDFRRGWLCACQFLTRLPFPGLKDHQPEDNGRALPLFPWVGLLIGALLAFTGWALIDNLPVQALAAILTIMWVLITGALHLDGLGDSADGWLSGKQGEELLEVMKDPRSGSAAVVAIVCLLLLKYALISSMLEIGVIWPLLLAPMLGRTMGITLLLNTPYVNPQGLGEEFLRHSSRQQLTFSVVASWVLLLIIAPLAHSLAAALMLAILHLGLRSIMVKRLQGTNGDTCGALIEISEAGALLAIVWMF